MKIIKFIYCKLLHIHFWINVVPKMGARVCGVCDKIQVDTRRVITTRNGLGYIGGWLDVKSSKNK